ncbi:class E sortase [Cellulomonas sp. S1-8]|uniref:class E sortase n=1 Tax=Cellulomonas sp. S1-8 TaxID=2904790 RepID=UPI00224432CC|nr:class E sortase [Cellulomonas sp. S1-8]UZN03389.1 class E sortase [Cellulomonas sp. S1-8]
MNAAPAAVRPPAHARTPRPRTAATFVYGAVGVLGELLITIGVLLLGFLVWQLWWTDVEGNAVQAEIVRELDFEQPVVTAADDGIAEPRRDEPPVMDEPAHATTFATLQVPRWVGEQERPISQGTDRPTVLDVLGIGHYEGTAMPGGVGNFALAGHRVTFGKPFNRIEELQVGDAMVVRTTDTWYVYKVTATEVVMPAEVRVIAPVPNQPDATPTERFITLTTCHPMFSARERYVVHGVLDYWAPVADGTPAELLG